jgi:hypothetical protein
MSERTIIIARLIFGHICRELETWEKEGLQNWLDESECNRLLFTKLTGSKKYQIIAPEKLDESFYISVRKKTNAKVGFELLPPREFYGE